MAISIYPRWPSAAILDSLEPNLGWIECTVCEIFAFKLYCDLETAVRGHWRSSKVALFDRAHTTLYSSSIVNMHLSITVSESAAYWSTKWPPAAILDFWHSKVPPLDRPSPKNPPQNQTSRQSANWLRTYSHFFVYPRWLSAAILNF